MDRGRARALMGLATAAAAACSRDPGTASHASRGPASDANALAPSTTPEGPLGLAQRIAPGSSPSAPPPGWALSPAAAGEAHRSTALRLEGDAFLRPHLAVLRNHFGPLAKGPYSVQRVDLAEGRTAVLVARSDEADPIVVAFDRDDLLWSKARPTAGILPPVRQLTLGPRPDGGVVLLGWVASLHIVAARMWADDGNPFGDFEIVAPSACDALSAAYGPGQGWVVVCASVQGTRAQRMREDGTIAWGRTGVALGALGTSGPASVVFDSRSSFLLLERVAAIGGDRLLAFRYDAEGQPLWPAPVDLGMDAPPRENWAVARADAWLVREGLVRVSRPSGVAGRRPGARTTDVTSDGEVRFP